MHITNGHAENRELAVLQAKFVLMTEPILQLADFERSLLSKILACKALSSPRQPFLWRKEV